MRSNVRGFLQIWAGQVLSLLGTSMTRFALMLWAWDETGAATPLALIGFFGIGTTVLLSPLAGALVDRFDRKRMMVLSDLGAGATTLTLLALHATGDLQIWQLYAAAVVAGAFETFQFPAYSAAITLLLPSRHYARASGLISLAETASRSFGPPAAAVLMPVIGFRGVLTLDLVTLTTAIVLLLLVKIPKPKLSASGAEGAGTLWRETLYGFRYIFHRKSLLWLQLLFSLANFLGAFAVILRAPMILARTDGDALILGNVQFVAGVGGIVGGVLLATWGGPKKRVHGVLAGLAIAMAGNLVLGVGTTPLVWAAGAFLFPFAITLTNGSNQAIWQAKVEPDVQGRVFAVRRQIAQLTMLPAMAAAGPLADLLFEPAMNPGGALTSTFGALVEPGSGAGMALLIVLASIVGIAAALFAATRPTLRELESSLPDHALARAG